MACCIGQSSVQNDIKKTVSDHHLHYSFLYMNSIPASKQPLLNFPCWKWRLWSRLIAFWKVLLLLFIIILPQGNSSYDIVVIWPIHSGSDISSHIYSSTPPDIPTTPEATLRLPKNGAFKATIFDEYSMKSKLSLRVLCIILVLPTSALL